MEELEATLFLFESNEDAKRAETEAEKVKFIKSKLNYNNVDSVLAVYTKIAESQMFQTPVGISYALDLHKFLIEHGKTQDLPPIRIKKVDKKESKEDALKQKIEELQHRFKYAFISAIVLLIMVITMFVITVLGTTPNILNYENALQNKYAAWEQQLLEREQKVREAEKELP